MKNNSWAIWGNIIVIITAVIGIIAKQSNNSELLWFSLIMTISFSVSVIIGAAKSQTKKA